MLEEGYGKRRAPDFSNRAAEWRRLVSGIALREFCPRGHPTYRMRVRASILDGLPNGGSSSLSARAPRAYQGWNGGDCGELQE